MKLSERKKQYGKYNDMTGDQLVDELTKLKREAFNLRFQKATGQLENTARVRELRRTVAQVQTVLSAKRAAKI